MSEAKSAMFRAPLGPYPVSRMRRVAWDAPLTSVSGGGPVTVCREVNLRPKTIQAGEPGQVGVRRLRRLLSRAELARASLTVYETPPHV